MRIPVLDVFTERPPLHWVGLTLVATFAFCRKAPAQRDFVIPFTYVNDFVVVDARLNGLFATKLLFDTGSEHTLLTEPLLFAGLDASAWETIRLIGSDLSTVVPAVLSRRNELDLGAITLSNQPIVAVDAESLDLTELAGEDIGGILGIGSFGAYVIVIDYRRSVLRLVPPARYRPPRDAIPIPMEIIGGKAYLRLDTRVHAAYADSLLYLVDSGAALESLIFADRADSTIYPPSIIAGVIGYGLGGALRGFVGRTDTLSLPGRPLPDVITHFQVADSTSARFAASRNGILGNRFLSRFTVALDLPGRVAYLVPRHRRPRSRPYDRSGLTLVTEPEVAGALRVQFVAPDTPAEEAGLRSGDRVRKVNGVPVRLRSPERVRRLLRRPAGKIVRLAIERGGERFTVAFALRDLI